MNIEIVLLVFLIVFLGVGTLSFAAEWYKAATLTKKLKGAECAKES